MAVGPLASGMAPHGDPPIELSETNNMKWKVAVPGEGHASPIVWDQQVFVLSAEQTDRKVNKAGSTGHGATGWL